MHIYGLKGRYAFKKILDDLILNASSGPPSPECCEIFVQTLV